MRLQFSDNFTFEDAARHIPYFAALGISHLYASPILKAHSASTHGYDLVDPTQVDPRLGGEDGLRTLVRALRPHGMGLIVDIVPNHMAVHGGQNAWWQDVLVHGPSSAYARYFDIDWDSPHPGLRGKVLLPILSGTTEDAIHRGELRLDDDPASPSIRYHEHRLPLRPEDRMHARDLPFSDLLRSQHYVLACWTEAAARINWRRFFDINELAALRIEDDAVFEATHRHLFELYEEGLIDGVRVDHIDGLADPDGYCRRLDRELADRALRRPGGLPAPAYVVMEKILADGEHLPPWPVAGTTGYDFMNEVSAWLHQEAGAGRLDDVWRDLTGDSRSFAEIDRLARSEILRRNFAADLERCARQLRLDFPGHPTVPRLTAALCEIVSVLPAYRTYLGSEAAASHDQAILTETYRSLSDSSAGIAEAICIYLKGMPLAPTLRPAIARLQQLSATISAKGTEDTAFYRYGARLSRNEVGATPVLLSLSTAELHERTAARALDFPAAMLATATHDTKRGEDSRARLAVLTEQPETWLKHVRSWLKTGPAAPHPADQLMLFQTLVGAWPMEAGAPLPADFRDRIAQWQRKSLREGKLRSSWSGPDESYEARCHDFLNEMLDRHHASIASLVARIAPAGTINSLSQVTLKLTQPGVPDFYQGADLWDLSLVDPDNRRPVDFSRRCRLAQELDGVTDLMTNWRTGAIKQALIARLLALRRRMPALFAHAGYEPVQVHGHLAAHLIAFRRADQNHRMLVLALRHTSALLADADVPLIPESKWRDTRLGPFDAGDWEDALSARVFEGLDSAFVSDILRDLPVAVLHSRASQTSADIAW